MLPGEARLGLTPLSHGRLALPLVPPSVNHQENKDQEAKYEQDNGSGFMLPEQLEASEDLIKIHAGSIYTSREGKGKPGLLFQ